MNTLKKSLISVALTASLGIVSSNAMSAVLPDFNVDPDMASPGTFFTADKINGNYAEIIDFSLVNTFETSIKVEFSAFVENDGVSPLGPLATGLGIDYSLYVLYTGAGTFGPGSVAGETEFLFTSSSFELYYDDLSDGQTVLTDPGDGNANLVWAGTTATDKLLASGALTGPSATDSNGGTLDNNCNGANCGSFGVTNEFTLTADGLNFFIEPVPFYNVTLGSGQFNSFTPTPGTTQRANGSADISFRSVPEPTSIALLGLGLLGLSMRRQKQAK